MAMNPVFKFPGELPFEEANALLIDPEALLTTTRATYEELAKTTTTLTLRRVPETDLQWILALFNDVQHLTLEWVTIFDRNWKGILKKLQTLRTLDCKIVEEVMRNFFKAILVSVQFIRSYHSVPFHNYEDQASFRDLIKVLPKTVRHFSTDIFVDSEIGLWELPLLEYFHSEFGFPERARDTIRTLICPRLRATRGIAAMIGRSELFKPGCFTQLQHLQVTSSVSLQEKERLQSVLPNLRTLDVHCYLPPVEEDLILTNLNDNCLLRILSFLGAENFAILSLVHPTFRRLIYTHILPSRVIDMERFLANFIHFSNMDEDTAYAELGKHIRNVFANGARIHAWMRFFTELESMIMHDERSRFKLNNRWGGDHPNQINFRLINRTLTSLTVDGLLCESDLMTLNKIRKFESTNAQDYNLLGFITQNRDHLESLKLDFEYYGYPMPTGTLPYDQEEERIPIEHRFVFCQLRNLKVLHLTHLKADFVMELRAEDFPVLEELNLSFKEDYKPQHQATLNSISRFLRLKSLSVWFNFNPLIEMPVQWLLPLKNLHTLGIVLEMTLLLRVLLLLPNVTTLEWWGNKYYTLAQMPFEMERNFKGFLEMINGQLTINFKKERCLVLP